MIPRGEEPRSVGRPGKFSVEALPVSAKITLGSLRPSRLLMALALLLTLTLTTCLLPLYKTESDSQMRLGTSAQPKKIVAIGRQPNTNACNSVLI